MDPITVIKSFVSMTKRYFALKTEISKISCIAKHFEILASRWRSVRITPKKIINTFLEKSRIFYTP